MTHYTGFDVAFRATTLDIAANLSMSTLFSSDEALDGRVFALTFDALLTTDQSSVETMPNGFKYQRNKGTGLRMAIRMWDLKSDFKLNAAAVAAQCKLGLASTSFRVTGVGIDDSVLATALDLPLTGTFDERIYDALRTVVSETLPAYLETPDLGVGVYAVPLESSDVSPSRTAQSICYAASSVGQRKKLSVALKNKPATIDREAVLVGYARFAGTANLEEDPQPTTEQATRANRWLATGSLT